MANAMDTCNYCGKEVLASLLNLDDICDTCAATSGDDDDDQCYSCSGTGEGKGDGATCSACHGKGYKLAAPEFNEPDDCGDYARCF